MLNKSKVVGVLALILFSLSSIPQSFAEGPKLWIESKGGFGGEYVTNGKIEARQGFFGIFNIRELVQDNPTALALVEKQEQANTYAHVIYWAGTLPSAVALGWGIGSQNTPLWAISAVALLGFSIASGHFIGKAKHYMYEAMNVYNGVTSSLGSPPLSAAMSFNF